MTLGGLALAIGMLVDDATVEVENIHRNRAPGQAAHASPSSTARSRSRCRRIVATLTICIVFFPVVLLVGPARFLFVPLALAVVLLDARVVPALAHARADAGAHAHGERAPRRARRRRRAWTRLARASTTARPRRSSASRTSTAACSRTVLAPPRASRSAIGAGRRAASFGARLRRRHRLLPVGRRRPDAAALPRAVGHAHRGDRAAGRRRSRQRIRDDHPAGRARRRINDMIGVPISYNLAFVQTDNVGGMDAEILIALKPDHHPTRGYMQQHPRGARRASSRASQLLLPAGRHREPGAQLRPGRAHRRADRGRRTSTSRYAVARKLRDAHRDGARARPTCTSRRCSTTRRSRSTSIASARRSSGCQQRDVANSMLISLSSSVAGRRRRTSSTRRTTSTTRGGQDAAAEARRRCRTSWRRRSTPPSAARCCSRRRSALADVAPQAPTQTLGNVADVSTRASRPIRSTTTPCSACSTSAPASRGATSASVAATSRRKIDALGPAAQGHADHACAGRTRS